MDTIINYLVSEFERLFPEQANYSELVRNAIVARTQKMRVIMTFYSENRGKSNIDDMCCRAFRAAIIDEASRSSPQSSFMLKGFATLNRKKLTAMIPAILSSVELATLLQEYPFIIPLVNEASSQEWLSSLLGQ